MFTAMEGELYEVASFHAGADDFIGKTTSIPCLASRLHAHSRKNLHGSVERPEPESVSICPLEARRSARLGTVPRPQR
jgi:DNA-binding response OmpR family regulator